MNAGVLSLSGQEDLLRAKRAFKVAGEVFEPGQLIFLEFLERIDHGASSDRQRLDIHKEPIPFWGEGDILTAAVLPGTAGRPSGEANSLGRESVVRQRKVAKIRHRPYFLAFYGLMRVEVWNSMESDKSSRTDAAKTKQRNPLALHVPYLLQSLLRCGRSRNKTWKHRVQHTHGRLDGVADVEVRREVVGAEHGAKREVEKSLSFRKSAKQELGMRVFTCHKKSASLASWVGGVSGPPRPVQRTAVFIHAD